MSRKYKTLKEPAQAFAEGELKGYYLMVDNDCAFLRYNGAIADGEDESSFRDEKNDEARQWYEGRGYADLVNALEAAGIPSRWC